MLCPLTPLRPMVYHRLRNGFCFLGSHHHRNGGTYAQSVFQNTAAAGNRGHGSAPAGPCGGVRHRRVGGYVCEALVRSGVGAFDLIDDDRVCLTNLNRQIIAGEVIRDLTAGIPVSAETPDSPEVLQA